MPWHKLEAWAVERYLHKVTYLQRLHSLQTLESNGQSVKGEGVAAAAGTQVRERSVR